ncbi:MAG: transglycosylase domain-containing protein [Chloroflexi bacterium]|nr:transglycosylase domain-containing protein [Chloroflexota bacterium]
MLIRLRRRSRLGKVGFLLLLLLVSLAGVFLAWALVDLPALEDLEARMALPSTRILDRHGRLLYEILPGERGRNRQLRLSQMPIDCVNAVIATEDANYFRHPGVDPVGIARALWLNLREGEIVAGGSTITQQTVRLLLFDQRETLNGGLRRKLREMVLALQLQARFSKEEILALYLNQVYFGNLAYGLEAAAQAYFAKGAADLSLAECALLTGIIQNAISHDPLSRFERAKARQAVVLRLMTENGFITEEQAGAAGRDELQFAAAVFPIEAPHFVMEVWRILERDYSSALHSGGLEVVTSVDLDWTKHAENIVRRQLHALNHPASGQRPAKANNAALVALDPRTGEVLTLLGSPDYFDDGIDGAVNAALAYRQPGSALKPFTYAEAMNPAYAEPYTAATMFLDVRRPFITKKLESYVPANYGAVEHGPVLLREALASSYNIPAVIALEHIGIERFVNFVSELGLENLRDNARVDLSITLGGGEVRLLDLVEAYAAFANGGYDIEPQLILSITDSSGKRIYEVEPAMLNRRLIDEGIAYIISDILADKSARIPAFGANSPLNLGFPAAAKTGTTTDFRDNWALGYTPELVVGVWVGNADNAPMLDVSGVSGAGPIYNLFMRAVTRGGPPSWFVEPPGLVSLEVCRFSGLLPTKYCRRRTTELFIPGTEPRKFDSFHQPFVIDRATGFIADENTRPADRLEQVFLVLPPEANDWALRHGLPSAPVDFGGLVSAAGGSLRWLSPDPYTVFRRSGQLPEESQRLRFAVGAPAGTGKVEFRLNGETVAVVDKAPWETWWTLTPGEYRLTARAMLSAIEQVESPLLVFSVLEERAQASYERRE